MKWAVGVALMIVAVLLAPTWVPQWWFAAGGFLYGLFVLNENWN
jgi:hypothetical protein